jgi:uncharacterized membrane protein YagU involved in acid resistance
MVTLLQSMAAGLVGTAWMTFAMAFVHRAGFANADMTRALGSWLTRSDRNALFVGLLVHAAAGALFGIPYAVALGTFASGGLLLLLGIGALLGLVHGLVMSLVLVAVVSDRHPVERFRDAGPAVAAAHVLGHVVYGLGVALMVGALGIDWGVAVP